MKKRLVIILVLLLLVLSLGYIFTSSIEDNSDKIEDKGEDEKKDNVEDSEEEKLRASNSIFMRSLERVYNSEGYASYTISYDDGSERSYEIYSSLGDAILYKGESIEKYYDGQKIYTRSSWYEGIESGSAKDVTSKFDDIINEEISLLSFSNFEVSMKQKYGDKYLYSSNISLSGEKHQVLVEADSNKNVKNITIKNVDTPRGEADLEFLVDKSRKVSLDRPEWTFEDEFPRGSIG